MRLCDLTDEQLLAHAANFRKIADWLGADERVSQTTGAISAAIEELVDRRAAMTDNRLAEMSFAYERATGVIESSCMEKKFDDKSLDDDDADFNIWYDLDTADVEEIEQEVDYLDSRRLLLHHPANSRWVSICDEGEPT